jgi:hypothetical protein
MGSTDMLENQNPSAGDFQQKVPNVFAAKQGTTHCLTGWEQEMIRDPGLGGEERRPD